MIFLLGLFMLFLFARPAAAISNPLAVPNNRYGIHIADPNDIPDVAPLVNSSGGDWGYVTLVIPKTDQNSEAWQKKFNPESCGSTAGWCVTCEPPSEV